jgi:hypothetical protein
MPIKQVNSDMIAAHKKSTLWLIYGQSRSNVKYMQDMKKLTLWVGNFTSSHRDSSLMGFIYN